MSRFTESKIAVEAVKVVEEYGELTMGELIDVLTERMQPSGHDMAIIANRNDTYFSQKVRNLRSHSNKIFFNNVYYDSIIDKYVSYECKKMKDVLEEKVYAETSLSNTPSNSVPNTYSIFPIFSLISNSYTLAIT